MPIHHPHAHPLTPQGHHHAHRANVTAKAWPDTSRQPLAPVPAPHPAPDSLPDPATQEGPRFTPRRCTLVNSPLATNVTGQMKDILTTALGMALFGDVRYSPLNVGGIVLGLLGSITYSAVSYREGKQAAQGQHAK